MAILLEDALAISWPDIITTISRDRLKLFATSTGATNSIYFDIDEARAAGYPDLPIPLSFFFSLGFEQPEPFKYLTNLDIDIRQLLHGEQSFQYHSMAFAGESITLRAAIVDCYSRKNGELEFLVKETEYFRGDELVAEARSVEVVQNMVTLQ